MGRAGTEFHFALAPYRLRATDRGSQRRERHRLRTATECRNWPSQSASRFPTSPGRPVEALRVNFEMTPRTSRRCRLLLQRLPQFVEQPRVLDGDNGLGGKRLQKRDLLIRKWQQQGFAARTRCLLPRHGVKEEGQGRCRCFSLRAMARPNGKSSLAAVRSRTCTATRSSDHAARDPVTTDWHRCKIERHRSVVGSNA